jgi:hypothetical protein
MGSDSRDSTERDMSEKGLPPPASAASEAKGLHSSVYIGYVHPVMRGYGVWLRRHADVWWACSVWIAMSASVILFNKWVLSTAKFRKLIKAFDGRLMLALMIG